MSETQTMENEVETNPIQDMIQHAISQDFNKANDVFGELMTVKMSDLLDQEKIKVAGQIYNGEEPEEEQLEFDLDDEEESSDQEEDSGDTEEETEEVQEPSGDVEEPVGDEDGSDQEEE